jgi:ABC-type bacteriocin/lantibiotic exporter with double-glycine peptidase domain
LLISINNFLGVLSLKKNIILFLFFIIFSLFSVFDILGLYLLSIGINGIFDKNIILEFLNNLKKFRLNMDYFEQIDTFYLFILIYFFLKNAFFYFIFYLQAYFLSKVSSDISNNLFKSFLRLNYINFLNLNTEENIKNLTNDISRSMQLVSSVNIIFKEFFLLLLISLFILSININFFLIILFFFLFLLSIFRLLYSKKLSFISNENQYYSKKQLKNIVDSLNLFIEVKIYNLIEILSSNFKKSSFNKEFAEQKLNAIINIPRLVIEVFFVILLYGFIIFINNDKINSEIINFNFLIILVLRSIPSIISINRAFFDFKFCNTSLQILLKKIKETNLNTENYINKPEKNFFFKNNIKFDNINYSYNRDKIILKNINLSIKKNQIIGITGESGAGKTTLLLLLLGILKPTSGKILVDGLNLKNSFFSLRNMVSFSPQETTLVNGTLCQNVTLKDKISKQEEIRFKTSLRIACADTFLRKKYKNIIVGEKGMNFSGGQKKRIGLARSLFMNKDIYILDEPTSFLDETTSLKLLRNLKSFFLNKSVIIISHDKKILKSCHKVYNLKKSKLFLKKN